MLTMKDIIEKTARLARLSFPEKDLERYTQKVTAVLEYVKQLEELDTKGIEPTSHAVEVTGKLREDNVVLPSAAEKILANAPEREGVFYQVPRVIDAS
jgi:aspartyl-tRNA(Asn)/glutamyl-tRNA(Gln) amidotransferase subunit C